MPRINRAESGPGATQGTQAAAAADGAETGLDTRLQRKSKVHPGDRARAGLVARLMAQLRQGLKAQGRDEPGLLGVGTTLGEAPQGT